MWWLTQSKGQECHFCGKLNHLASICGGKSRNTSKPHKPHHEKAARAKPANMKPLTSSESESENEDYLYPVHSKQKARPYAKFTVSGHSFLTMVDTAASVKVLDRKTFSKMADVTLVCSKIKASSVQFIATSTIHWKISSCGANKETLYRCNLLCC